MKPNGDLSPDEFYLSKNLKRAALYVGDLKGELDNAKGRARKINHETQFYINAAILAAEESQRSIMYALGLVHSDDAA